MLQVRIMSCNFYIVHDLYMCMHVCIFYLVGKQLLNARKLEALLTASEQRREQERARAKKRSRSGAPISCKTEAADGEHPRGCPFFCSLSRPPSFSLSFPPPSSPLPSLLERRIERPIYLSLSYSYFQICMVTDKIRFRMCGLQTMRKQPLGLFPEIEVDKLFFDTSNQNHDRYQQYHMLAAQSPKTHSACTRN